jgi:hypothetical protein
MSRDHAATISHRRGGTGFVSASITAEPIGIGCASFHHTDSGIVDEWFICSTAVVAIEGQAKG